MSGPVTLSIRDVELEAIREQKDTWTQPLRQELRSIPADEWAFLSEAQALKVRMTFHLPPAESDDHDLYALAGQILHTVCSDVPDAQEDQDCLYRERIQRLILERQPVGNAGATGVDITLTNADWPHDIDRSDLHFRVEDACLESLIQTAALLKDRCERQGRSWEQIVHQFQEGCLGMYQKRGESSAVLDLKLKIWRSILDICLEHPDAAEEVLDREPRFDLPDLVEYIEERG